MCGRKLVDRKMNKEQMDMLKLKETVYGLAIANGWVSNSELNDMNMC